jgi:ATP-binding cassette subfamily C protein LapB
MIYKDFALLQNDFDFITNKCSLEYFWANKPSDFELEEELSKVKNLDNKTIKDFYERVLKKFELITYKWKNELKDYELPALALIPNEGLKILIEKNSDGSYKCEDALGESAFVLNSTDISFLPFKLNHLEKDTIKTASQVFKTTALKYKKYIFYIAIASLSMNILALGISFFSMQVYDRVIPSANIYTLVALSIGVLIAIFLEFMTKIAKSTIIDGVSSVLDLEYSHHIFDRFLKIRCDVLPKNLGLLSGQIQSYASIRTFIISFSSYILIDLPFSMIFVIAIIAIGGINMGIVLLTFFALAILLGLIFKKRIENLTQTSSMASYKKLGLLVETIENAELIKANGGKGGFINKWNALTKSAIDDDIKIKEYSDLVTYISALLQNISYICLVGLGAYLITNEKNMITMGALIAVTILSNRVLSPLSQLPNIFVLYGKSKMAIRDLNKLYEHKVDNDGIKREIYPNLNDADIVCSKLKFAYQEETSVIDIDKLTIPSGNKIGILGVIGCGKSTLLKILAGIYAPTSGKIFVDNIDMQHISRTVINKTIGYLPQSTKLLCGTLRENLIFGLSSKSDDEILEACRKTGLITLISSLPQGLDTAVPEGGDSVSGGQKQLIAITRIFLANPKILILDEPTASLDDGTERFLIKAISSILTPNHTLILATHKVSLLSLVDRLIVLGPNQILMDNEKNIILNQLMSNQKN